MGEVDEALVVERGDAERLPRPVPRPRSPPGRGGTRSGCAFRSPGDRRRLGWTRRGARTRLGAVGPGTRFDFVVVGAGAAGCVIAGRLAAAGAGSVLLLEAGPDLRDETSQGSRTAGSSPSRRTGATPRSRPTVASRRSFVGAGSSAERRGSRGSPSAARRADFDEWAALGNPGWAFDAVLPYFRRLETDVDFGDQPWHGNLGPIPVNRYRDLEMTEVHDAAIRGALTAGFPWVEDHNQPAGGRAAGSSSVPPTQQPPRIELPGLTDDHVRRLEQSAPLFARTATRSRMSSGPARWARGQRKAPWSTRTAASTESRTCSSPTRRSSRSHRPASATSRR